MTTQPGRITRTFKDIPDGGNVSKHMLEVDALLGGRGLGWAGLLEARRILIFSEAGVGKTFECQAERTRLWDAGKPAFFLELAQLARRELRAMLSPEEENRFDAWSVAPGEEAVFFLDSYDELKLTMGSFKQALTTLAKALAGKLGRARIVVTSRPIPLDEELFRSLLPIPVETVVLATELAFAEVALTGSASGETKSPEDKVWRRVLLQPLTDTQIRQMAAARGVSDPDALLADIRRRNAQSFARRPQDLIDLCADWNDKRRIRTHRQQLASNIEIKLKPRKDRAEKIALSYDKALDGARRLAVATLLTRKLTLRHSAASDVGDMDEAALDPGSILTDWSADDIATLLERPLFGFASYGRVRFHHRSIIEFLAAEQLARLMARGMTRRALNRLLLAKTAQGDRVVKPSMRAVVAWLAGSDTAMFEEVLDREPELLLDAGDPASLSLAQRRRALRAYVDRYGPGGWRGLHVPTIQIHRFADVDLEADIIKVWSAGVENAEVREMLLSLVAAGKMTGCGDIALEAAMNPQSAYGERADAIEALVALNHPRLGEMIASLAADTGGRWEYRISRWCLLRLFPGPMSVAEALSLMGRLTESRREVTGISWQLPQNISQADLSAESLDELRIGLTELVFSGANWSEESPHLQSPRQFLVPALAAVCARLLALGKADADVLRSSSVALRLVDREYGEEKPSEVLRQILNAGSPALREAIFVAEDAFSQSLDPKDDAWNRFYEAAFRGPLRLDPDKDADWVVRGLADSTTSPAFRAVLLEAAFQLARAEEDVRAAIESLRVQVADDDALLARIADRLRPAKRNRRWKAFEAKSARRDERQKRKALRDRASWIQFWREVAEHPEKVFAPDRADNTTWNLWHAMARSGEDGRGSGWKRPFIEQYFGRESADRLRQALMGFWRNDTPTLISEREADARNTYLTRWQLGLAGIAAESEDSKWIETLTPEEVALSLRYVSVELGGFPSWLDSLAASHPEIVDTVLGGELSWELAQPASELGISSMVQNIRQASPKTAAIFLPRLWSWLNDGENAEAEPDRGPGGLGRLEQVVGVLLAFGDDELKRSLLDLALAQMAIAPDGPGSRVWLTMILRMRPAQGVEVLEEALAEVEVGQRGIGVSWFGALFGDRFSGPSVDLNHEGFTPAVLLRLIKIAYTHVREPDDAIHVGSYSPDIRDHAERGRNAVLGALMAAKGPDAWSAKLALAADPLCAHFQDRIRRLARDRAAEEMDGVAINEAEVVTLSRYGELPPGTRDEMFAVMSDRLSDLEDLLLRDDSPRQAWADIKDEGVMRREIARELRHASHHSYTVDQEAVTADNKETDIRLRSVVSDQQAVIELKIGEQPRSARDLESALRDQLLVKYMAPESSRAGCLLITVCGDRTWKHPDTGASLDLAGLIAFLNEVADAIALEMGGTVKLMARGLDLRPRLGTEKANTSQATP